MILLSKMIKIFSVLLLLISLVSGLNTVENGCVSFYVSQGTGCDWMCNYCSNQLGTNNYYFTDNVCSYQTSGCVGNPIAGKQYTCCQAQEIKEEL